jgi:hypothetical protein
MLDGRRRDGHSDVVRRPGAGANPFPYFPAMHRNVGSGCKAKFHAAVAYVEQRNGKEGLKPVLSPNHDGLMTFSCQS